MENTTHFGFNKTEGYYPSKDRGRQVYYVLYTPVCEPVGIFQIAHGMDEYIGRYDNFASFLAERGFVVCGEDHLGHGLTAVPEGSDNVPEDNDLGYFAKEKGWQKIVSDMHTLTDTVKAMFPDVPYFFMGHSMGSFLARAYIEKYGSELAGAVICGTSGGTGAESQLLVLLDGIEKVRGERYRLNILNKMIFGKNGAYNAKIKDKETRYDWISRDKEVVARYAADPFCTYDFTVNGYKNMMEVLYFVNRDRWFENYPKSLPTYLISGSADPVGDYGRGVLKVYNRLRLYDCDVEMKIYSGARHELLNELNRGEVYEDIYDFITSISGRSEGGED